MQLPKTGDLILGKYVLEGLLGEGGMGLVYSARHELLGQRVAVKLIRPEYATRVDTVSRFVNEARAAASIQNEHIAHVLDVGSLDGGLPYMVLEYLDGQDLASVLQSRGPLPVTDVADYLLQAIEAIAHAHALGIVHRDLKPSNLFLAKRQDDTVCLKVLDFGISKVLGTGTGAGNMTKTDSLLGSPLYMSPEQLRDSKNVDHRCDIWALGVVAYELLMGQTPFAAENAVALFAAIQETEPPSMRASRSFLQPEVEALVLRCLRRHRAERFASVTELAIALAPFGTSVAQSALENTKRILPIDVVKRLTLEDSAAPLRPTTSSASRLEVHVPLEAVAATAPMPLESAPGPGGSDRPAPAQSNPLAGTGGGITGSRPVTAAPRGRGGLFGALGLFGLVVAGIVAVVLLPHGSGAGVVTRGGPSPSSAPSSAPPASATAALADEAPSAAPSAIAPPPDASVAAAAASSAVVPISPPASARVSTPKGARAAASAPTAAEQPPPPPVAPAPNCSPPYEFDSSGKKIWKRACL